VHGANRLASNSLLEAVVYSHRAAEQLELELLHDRPVVHDPAPTPGATATTDPTWQDVRTQLREVMWTDAGIIRSDARLERAAQRLRSLHAVIGHRYAERGVSPEAVEARNLGDIAFLIVRCAQLRKESRGLHYNTDYPYRDNELFLKDTVAQREGI
jgi:L-aspartate oxidase